MGSGDQEEQLLRRVAEADRASGRPSDAPDRATPRSRGARRRSTRSRLRRATGLPVVSQNSASSGRQSSIQRPVRRAGAARGCRGVGRSASCRRLEDRCVARVRSAVSEPSTCPHGLTSLTTSHHDGCHHVPMARAWRRTHLGTDADRATFRTLHSASLASPALRAGLTTDSAGAVRSSTCAPCSAAPRWRSRTRTRSWPGTAPATTTAPRPTGSRARRSTGAPPGSSTAPTCRATRPAARCAPRWSRRWSPTSGSSAPSRCSRRTRPRAWPEPPTRWPVGLRTARPRRARRQPHPGDGGRGPGPARADQPALHLQLARRDRELRAHRSRPGPRAAARVRRLHPLLVPQPRRLHDAGRGAALRRALPVARAGPLRRPSRR